MNVVCVCVRMCVSANVCTCLCVHACMLSLCVFCGGACATRIQIHAGHATEPSHARTFIYRIMCNKKSQTPRAQPLISLWHRATQSGACVALRRTKHSYSIPHTSEQRTASWRTQLSWRDIMLCVTCYEVVCGHHHV